MRQEFSKEDANKYIEELYKVVLNREAITERERSEWLEALNRLGDPVSIFRKFVYSEERRNRQALEDASHTKYPNGHFYSPVVNRQEAEKDLDLIFGKRDLREVNLNADWQQTIFKSITPHFSSSPFSFEKTGQLRYHYKASGYSFGDAIIYWGLLSSLRPAKIVEIGCGNSSICVLDAIEALNLSTSCTFIDPYPERLIALSGGISPPHSVLVQPVQRVSLEVFSALRRDDILFIDTSHVVKTGSDVHFEITQILPVLAPGVLIHFHDIYYPFEYGYKWIVKDNNSWNESYFIHSFLMYNDAFRIELFNHYLAKEQRVFIENCAPAIADQFFENPGGGLWLRKVR